MTPRPSLDGARERRIDDQEFYQLLDRNGIFDDIHLFNQKLREWQDYCNYHRPHGGLQDQTPFERLIAKTRADVSQGSWDPTKVESELAIAVDDEEPGHARYTVAVRDRIAIKHQGEFVSGVLDQTHRIARQDDCG